mmetsp:Transcript_30703/g.89083  ORF Transcript_30703/g.89083 Transcript_30703/m.89083 type:complete len:257 (-) Transcript_30703:1317-2087(-)
MQKRAPQFHAPSDSQVPHGNERRHDGALHDEACDDLATCAGHPDLYDQADNHKNNKHDDEGEPAPSAQAKARDPFREKHRAEQKHQHRQSHVGEEGAEAVERAHEVVPWEPEFELKEVAGPDVQDAATKTLANTKAQDVHEPQFPFGLAHHAQGQITPEDACENQAALATDAGRSIVLRESCNHDQAEHQERPQVAQDMDPSAAVKARHGATNGQIHHVVALGRAAGDIFAKIFNFDVDAVPILVAEAHRVPRRRQ